MERSRVEVRVSPQDRSRWAALAAKTGETLSAWLRRLAFEQERRDEDRRQP